MQSGDAHSLREVHRTSSDEPPRKPVSGANRTPEEREWVKRSDFFERRGYSLRPRYHNQAYVEEEWQSHVYPANGFLNEEYIDLPLLRKNVIDAVRNRDGLLVCIKRVRNDSKEISILAPFSSGQAKEDPRNHTVPVLEILEDPDPAVPVSYIIMPFLRPCDSPPFELVDDVIDIVGQLLEGLQFMHTQGVAHRDGVYQNILMDGSSLYPTGFHPVQLNQQRDIRKDAQPYARFTAPKPVRYYFVSFGVAHYVDDRSQPESGLSPKTLEGYDIIVPELQDGSEPYDPFSLDIFLLGDFFKRHMYERYSNVEFLAPFVTKMTAQDPHDRPSAAAVLTEWKETIQTVSFIDRTHRLLERDNANAREWPLEFLLPFLSAGPVLFIEGMLSGARWTKRVQGDDARA